MKYNNGITLNELIEQITSSVEPSWDTLKKIRHVYIELGKYLEKNTDFFMTVMHKVHKDYELKPEVIENIYNDDLDDGERRDWNKVICRSAAILLSKCLNKLNIENKLIYSSGTTSLDEMDDESFEIRHVFVNAKIDDDKSIFLTLAADLPYIQNNFRTNSFGNLIRYKHVDEHGNEHQVYEGPEVTNLVEVSKDELFRIDKELGYTYIVEDNDEPKYVYGNYFFDSIKQKLSGNKLYLDLLAQDTDFYQDVLGSHAFKANIKNVIKLKNITKRSCEYISRFFDFDFKPYDIERFDYNKWYNDITEFAKNREFDVVGNDYGDRTFENILRVNDSFVNIVADLATSILDNSITEESLIQYRNRFYKKLLFLSRLFVDNEYLPHYDENGVVNQNYISKKLQTIFKYAFSCNDEVTDFNRLSYNEQIAIIRLFIPIIFGDISEKNTYEKGSNPPIFNVIRTYTYRMKSDGSYELVFEIDNHDVKDYYTYNLSSNKFKRITQTKFWFTAVNNIICSKDLKDKLNIEKDVENKRRLN